MYKLAFEVGRLIYNNENFPSHYSEQEILSRMAKRLVYDEYQIDALIAGYKSQHKEEGLTKKS